MTSLLRPALSLFALLGVLTGLAYPLAVTGVGQLLFAHGRFFTSILTKETRS